MELQTGNLIIAQRPETVGKYRDGQMVKMRDPRKDIYCVTNLYKVVLRGWSGKKSQTLYTTTTPDEIDAMKAQKAKPRLTVWLDLFTSDGAPKNETHGFVMRDGNRFDYRATRLVEDMDTGTLYPLTALTKGRAQVEMVEGSYSAAKEAVAANNDTAWRNA